YEKNLKEINDELEVDRLACPTFVPMIESGDYLRNNPLEEIRKVLMPLKQNKSLDTLVLGCTHYPLIAEEIQEIFGEDVIVISSIEETEREGSVILNHKNSLNKGTTKRHLLLITANTKNFTLIYENIFDNTLKSFSDVERNRIKLKELEESYL